MIKSDKNVFRRLAQILTRTSVAYSIISFVSWLSLLILVVTDWLKLLGEGKDRIQGKFNFFFAILTPTYTINILLSADNVMTILYQNFLQMISTSASTTLNKILAVLVW